MRISTIIIISIIITSCDLRYQRIEYPDGIEYFNPEFYSHFPIQVPTAYSKIKVSLNTYKSHPFIWLLYYDSQSHIDSLEIKLDASYSSFNSDDSCLLVIDKHLNPDNWRSFDKHARVPRKYNYLLPNCSKLSPPIPKFYEESWYETNNTLVGLDGWVLYVLDSKPGIFMEEDKLPNGLFTPLNWEHGYSKGIALNTEKNAVIYWADIW